MGCASEIPFRFQCSVSQGYDSLIENLIDVSHVPFAHHGLQGRAERLKSNAQGVCRSAHEGVAGVRDL